MRKWLEAKDEMNRILANEISFLDFSLRITESILYNLLPI